jgi:dihydroflavonol-4-reductase
MRFVIASGMSCADVRDVAAGLIGAAERGRAGERYVLASREGNITFKQLFAMVAKVSGRKRIQLALPRAVALTLTRIAPWPVTAGVARVAAAWWFCDESKAQSELDYRARPCAETVEDTVRYVMSSFRS